MNRTITIAPVRKAVIVKAPPSQAFEVFTARIDHWWPKSHSLGGVPIVESIIEPFEGGRWYTKRADGTEVVVGHIRIWEPGKRFVLCWEVSAGWQPEPRVALSSEVEVRFLPAGQGATRVELEHRDFERMGAKDGESMRSQVDGGWPSLLALFAKEAGGGATG